jgi:hypothetical protein
VIVDSSGIFDDTENWDKRLWPQVTTTVNDMHIVHEHTISSGHFD